jgi:biopolymer transport protein ExbD
VNADFDNLMDDQPPAPVAPGEALRKKRRPRPRRREITLNLVAMLDMSFQLLIFFVLTANFAAAEGVLSANLPAGDAATDSSVTPPIARPPLNIRIRNISATGVILALEVDGGASKDLPDCAALTRELLQRQGRDGDGKLIPGSAATLATDDPIRIAPDSDTAWQDVVAVFNATMRAGLTSVGFAPVTPGQ